MASTPIGTVQGLASGIQWQDMIDQIIQAESTPITNLNTQISSAKARESAWSAFKARIQAFSDATRNLANGTALGSLRSSITGLGFGTPAPFNVTTSSSASPGDYQVAVTRLASAEKLGGRSYASSTNPLGLAGEFLLNGQDFQVAANDSLTSIAARINAANSGSTPLGVSASVVGTTTGGYRLVLTSAKTGAAGIDLVDGRNTGSGGLGLLEQLGLVAGASSETVRNPLSNGMKSGLFADATTAVGSLLKLSSPPLSASLTIGGHTVVIDLATESLTDIKNDFNTAVTGDPNNGPMQVATDATTGKAYLQYAGATTIGPDADKALQLLGFTRAGRSSVAQQIQGTALSDAGNGGAAATKDTLLTDLGARVGETIDFSGTRGDGTTVSIASVTVSSTTRLSDVLASLNDATTGFGAGSRKATADIVGGKLTLTDLSAGDSLLSLQAVANNELGGTLDFGALTATQSGQTRQITTPMDALIQIDGTPVQRSSNTITDGIPGVTLNLASLSPTPVTLSVTQDNDSSAAAIKAFATAYNGIADFVTQQTTLPPNGASAPPLFSDSVMRSMRTSLNAAMQLTLPTGVAGTYTRLADLGIEIDKTGHYTIDDAKLSSAVAADPSAVTRLFGLSGTSANAALSYVSAADQTKAATYSVQITSAATQATQAGSASSATGTGTMTVRDVSSGKDYTVAVTDGESAADIATALNTEFAKAAAQVLRGGTGVTDSLTGAAMTDATTWANAQDSLGNRIAQNGDRLTISGTKADGTSFTFGYTVADGTTLGDLRTQVQQQFGSAASVTWDANGKLTVTSATTGSSLLALAITSSGSNAAPFGSVGVATQGRPVARVKADTDGSGNLRLTSSDYGSAVGFTVSYSGTDAGLAAGAYNGADVAGLLNGVAATGIGQVLTGATGTDADGLMIRYSGTDTGSVGSLTFSRGIASAALVAATPMLGTDNGSIDALTQSIDDSIASDNSRIDDIQARLDLRRQQLTAQFTAMEQAIARSQSQMQWLTGQINSLAGYGNSSSSK